jgi:NADH-quinone oxidoreductase subunit K
VNGVPLAAFLGLSVFLFSVGVIGVVIRRNPIVVFMCIELMLNAVNLTFIAFARYKYSGPGAGAEQAMSGPAMVVFVMAVAAAEVAIGLAIIMAIYRLKDTIDVDEMNVLSG